MVLFAALTLWCLPAAVMAQDAVAQATASQAWSPVDEDWMIMAIGDARVGWSSTLVEQSGEQLRTTSKTQMKIGRGPTSVEISLDAVFIETADGAPVQVQYVQKMAMQAVDTTWVFTGDKVLQTRRTGGNETTSEVDAPEGDWLMPRKAEAHVLAQHQNGIEEFSYKTINPENGLKLVTITSTRSGETDYDVDGKPTKVNVWKSVTDLVPIVATEYYNQAGDMVYQETPTGLGKIVMRRATKAQALDEPVGEAPEILVRTFITPDREINNSMKSTRAKLRLVAKNGELPVIPSAGAQRVEMAEDGKSALLVIDITDNLPASAAEVSSNEFTKPSAVVDFDDALVTKISEAAKGKAEAMDKADALRKVTHDRISKKGMATAFAAASETARTRTGDCSEHGVLLCALLRAQGIPARVAMGLVYVDEFMGKDGIFGWHMWTQALIDGQWVDLDATLPVRYNAVHVLTNVSSLADGLGAADMASILQLIGNVDIEVIDVEYD
jgi:hypothetical protein